MEIILEGLVQMGEGLIGRKCREFRRLRRYQENYFRTIILTERKVKF